MSHLPDEALYAFADERLPKSERRAAAQHLRTCAECRARLARSRAVTRALKELREEQAPATLHAAIRNEVAPRSAGRMGQSAAGRGWLVGVALSAVLVAVFFATITSQPPSLLTQLAEIHASLARGSAPVQVRGDAGAVNGWFASSLQWDIRPADIEGMELVGGRIDTIEGRPSPHLVYQQDDGTAMSLLIWSGTAALNEFAPQHYESGYFYVGTRGAETVVVWPVGDLRYACIGDQPADLVLDMAGKVRRSLNN